MANPHVDPDACIGCGLCADICPQVFEMDDDEGVAVVREDADLDADCIQEAADSCPTDAISV
ncbi:MAG: ferredoxin [Limnochordia bacterium]|jgi:ferredoxin